jgi:hypothetical protein
VVGWKLFQGRNIDKWVRMQSLEIWIFENISNSRFCDTFAINSAEPL